MDVGETAVAVGPIFASRVSVWDLAWVPVIPPAVVAPVAAELDVAGAIDCHADTVAVVSCNSRILGRVVGENNTGRILPVSAPEGIDVIPGVLNEAVFHSGILHVAVE